MKSAVNNTHSRLTVLGGTGPVAKPIIRTLIEEGVQPVLLARRPDEAQERFPEAEIVPGSMLDAADAARAMQGADAALLITPIGGNDCFQIELDCAQAAIEGARQAGLPHLLFVSVIGIDAPTGVPMLDSKRQIEEMLADSGLPWTSLRAGSYMDDVIDTRAAFIRRGWWPFPVPSDYAMSFTAQRDVARVTALLVQQGHSLNAVLDVVEPLLRSPSDVAANLSQVSGRHVHASGNRLLLPVLRGLKPIFRRVNPRMASIVSLVEHFDHQPYTGDPGQLARVLPDFEPTSLDEHLKRVFG